MIIPVRCFTCNKILASKYEKYKQLIQENKQARLEQGLDKLDNILSGDDVTMDETHSSEVTEVYKTIFKQIGIERYCCKRCIISHVDLIDKI